MGKYVFPSALLACFILFVFVPKNQVSFPEHLKRKSRPLQSAHVCMAHAFQLFPGKAPSCAGASVTRAACLPTRVPLSKDRRAKA